MKFCITPIHLGRYKIEMISEETNQVVTGTDGGSALVMLMLSKWLFEPEHIQYQRDQRTNSDAIGNALIEDMNSNPLKYVEPPRQLLNPGKKPTKVIGPLLDNK